MPNIRTDQGAKVRLDHYTHHIEYHHHPTDHPGFTIGHSTTRRCELVDCPTDCQEHQHADR